MEFFYPFLLLDQTSALSTQTHTPCCVERFLNYPVLKVWRRMRRRRMINSPSEDPHSIGTVGKFVGSSSFDFYSLI